MDKFIVNEEGGLTPDTSKTKEQLSVVKNYFSASNNRVKKKESFEKLSPKEKVFITVLLGELRFYEHDSRYGYNAIQIGEAMDAVSGQTLEWNYYAHLRSMEQDEIVYRYDNKDYVVLNSKLSRFDL